MNRRALIPPSVFLLGMALAACGDVTPSAPRNKPLRVTCTTTLLSAVVRAVGGDRVAVHTIVPFGMCPGHFDLTPGEADKLRNAELLLYHGFEHFMVNVEPGAKTRKVRANVPGNWMLPTIHTQAVARVCAVLTEAQPASETFFAERAERYSTSSTEAAQHALERLVEIRGTPVVCATMSRELATWLGVQVVAEFERDEAVSIKALHAILSKGKQAGAALVIDNRQSSGKLGQTIADALGVPLAMLSNFPATDTDAAGQPAYLEALSQTCATVLQALDPQTREP